MKENQLSWTLAILIHLLILLFLFIHQVKIPIRLEVENIEIIALDDFFQENKVEDQGLRKTNNKLDQGSQGVSAQSRISLPGTTTNFNDAVKLHNLPMKKGKRFNDNLLRSNIDESFNTTGQNPKTTVSTNDKLTSGSSISQYNGDQGTSRADRVDGSSSFQMEGEVVNRQLLKKTLPKYPEDMQKDGVVSLKFSVLADGSVSEIIIVKKSDPIFENLSISALNQWKFNRSDKKNSGIISFRFKLE